MYTTPLLNGIFRGFFDDLNFSAPSLFSASLSLTVHISQDNLKQAVVGKGGQESGNVTFINSVIWLFLSSKRPFGYRRRVR